MAETAVLAAMALHFSEETASFFQIVSIISQFFLYAWFPVDIMLCQ
jgi:hypothetical protein